METFHVDSISLRFSDDAADVLDNVSLELRPGQLTLVCGANGSGKSILLRSCLALEKPYKGQVTLDGVDVTRHPRALYKRSSAVFQNPDVQIFGMTVDEDLGYSGATRDTQERAVAILGLEDLRDRAPATLSGGQRQRLVLASAFIRESELYFLDEPASALDYPYLIALRSLIQTARSRGSAILMTVHDIRDFIDIADTVIVLKDGRRIFSGSPGDSYDYISLQNGLRPVNQP